MLIRGNHLLDSPSLVRRSPSPESVVPRTQTYRGLSWRNFGDFLDDPQHQEMVDSASTNTQDISAYSGGLNTLLNSIVPPNALQGLLMVPLNTSSTNLTFLDFSTVHSNILSLLAANNFPGLSQKGVEAILRRLQRRPRKQLEALFFSIKGPAKPVLAENLFFYAIKFGDERMAEALLKSESLSIDVDKEISMSGDEESRYNPLALCCKFKQLAVLRVLLHYNANVDIADCGGDDKGLLEIVIEGWGNENADIELVGQLLKAGARIRDGTPLAFCKRKRFEVLHLLMCKRLPQDYHKWHQQGIFHEYLWAVDHEECTRIVDLMLAVGVDLDRRNDRRSDYYSYKENFGYGATVIEVLSRKGFLQLVRKLLQSSACLTDYTLLSAIKSENVELIQFLLDAGANVNALVFKSKYGTDYVRDFKSTPFAEAILTENSQVIQILVQQGALRDIKMGRRFQAAMEAASTVGNIQVIQTLLTVAKHGFTRDTDVTDPRFIAPFEARVLQDGLIAAIKADHEALALQFVRSGMEITDEHLDLALFHGQVTLARTLLDSGVGVIHRCGKGMPLLQSAIHGRNHTIINELIARGAPVNKSYGCNGSPLLTAIRLGDTSLVKILLDAGAIVDELYTFKYHQESMNYGAEYDIFSDRDDHTALSTAVYFSLGNFKMVQLVLRYGAEPNDSLALAVAVLLNDRELITVLLQAFSARYPHGSKNYGSLALIAAAEVEDSFWTELIIEKVDAAAFCTKWEIEDLKRIDQSSDLVSQEDLFKKIPFYKVTPLGYIIWRSEHQSIDKAQLLLKHKVDPNGVIFEPLDHDYPKPRKTALLLAIDEANIPMIRLLLQFNADINGAQSCSRTPLQLAAEEGNFEIVQLLLINGAVANDQPAGQGGGTALQLAAIKGFIGIVSLLLDNGANINAPPSRFGGRSALEGAAEWGRLDMVKFLMDNRFDIESASGRQHYRAAKHRARNNAHKATLDLLESYHPNARPSPEAVFIDQDDWTFLGVETENGFEAWEGEIPETQDLPQMSDQGLSVMDTEILDSQDLWMPPGYL